MMEHQDLIPDKSSFSMEQFDALQIEPGSLVVVDEADTICSPSSISSKLKWLINYGRHLDVDLICVSRRPARVSKDLTSLAEYTILFRVTGTHDKQALIQYTGSFDLATLNQFEYIISED